MAVAPSIGRIEPAEADLTRTLYERYAAQIHRYCLHQLGSREEAEDAVQSTFLNAFRGLKRGVVPELESAWLFKIAHNVCLSRRRSTWRRGRIESPTEFDLVAELTPAPTKAADELIGLQDVLEQMPEQQRRAILLREWQGLSYREIAEELDVSQAAVETLIFRARRSLASGLEQPVERRRGIARASDLGILAWLKSFALGGGAAAKLAATVAVVGATTVVAVAPVRHALVHHGKTPPAVVPAASASPNAGGAANHGAAASTHRQAGHAPPAGAKAHHATKGHGKTTPVATQTRGTNPNHASTQGATNGRHRALGHAKQAAGAGAPAAVNGPKTHAPKTHAKHVAAPKPAHVAPVHPTHQAPPPQAHTAAPQSQAPQGNGTIGSSGQGDPGRPSSGQGNSGAADPGANGATGKGSGK